MLSRQPKLVRVSVSRCSDISFWMESRMYAVKCMVASLLLDGSNSYLDSALSRSEEAAIAAVSTSKSLMRLSGRCILIVKAYVLSALHMRWMG